MSIARVSLRHWLMIRLAVVISVLTAGPVLAQSAVQQALVQAVAGDRTLQEFYGSTGYAPLWVGDDFKSSQRVAALTAAMAMAGEQGLSQARHNPDSLRALAQAAQTPMDQAKLEMAYSNAFLAYASDVQSGMLNPRKFDGVERDRPLRSPVSTLRDFAASDARGFLNQLPPQTPEYARLMQEKLRLERLIASGWGEKVPGALEPGQSNPGVVLLRQRLSNLGYSGGGASPMYDQALQVEVARFQKDHGLHGDGVVGKNTVSELNKHPVDRLASVLVAMERERWMNFPRGDRYVWVNIPDFTAKIIDGTSVTFETKTVVGKDQYDHRSPEFSDQMDFMVINPTWSVPRSIVVKEYLPMLKADRNAASQLQLLDQNGQVVSRGAVDFASFTEANFPYALKEPPSLGNALGTVKFMFPNKYNIYLHDTPQKSLFSRDLRAFSHGCIRLNDPHDFAYALLKRQTSDPVGTFQNYLATRREVTLPLQQPVPVHIDYRTAFTQANGPVQYRRDVYGRDAAIFQAMQNLGVAMRVM